MELSRIFRTRGIYFDGILRLQNDEWVISIVGLRIAIELYRKGHTCLYQKTFPYFNLLVESFNKKFLKYFITGQGQGLKVINKFFSDNNESMYRWLLRFKQLGDLVPVIRLGVPLRCKASKLGYPL